MAPDFIVDPATPPDTADYLCPTPSDPAMDDCVAEPTYISPDVPWPMPVPPQPTLMMISWDGDPGEDDHVTLWDPETGDRRESQFDPSAIYQSPEGCIGYDGRFYLGIRGTTGIPTSVLTLKDDGTILAADSGDPVMNGYPRALAISPDGSTLVVHDEGRVYKGTPGEESLAAFLEGMPTLSRWMAWVPDGSGVIIGAGFAVPNWIRRYDLGGNMVWSVDLGNFRAEGITVIGDMVYIGHRTSGSLNSSNIRRFNVSDGSEDTDGWPIGPFGLSQAVTSGRGDFAHLLYFIDLWNIRCYDSTTGTEVFAIDAETELDPNLPPVRLEPADDGGVFVASRVAFGSNPGMRAARLGPDGAVLWQGEHVSADGEVMGLAHNRAEG